jgi:hypothetical protein
MLGRLIRCGFMLLSASIWCAAAGAVGSGPHGPPLHGGLVGHMKRGAGHAAGHMGIFFPVEPAQQFMNQLSGEPGPAPAYFSVPVGGPVVAGAEHMIAAHLTGAPMPHFARLAERVELGQAMTAQTALTNGAGIDQGGVATAQPLPPTASPLPSRPPGASGPGWPMSGSWGPGLPGPGRPPSPG